MDIINISGYIIKHHQNANKPHLNALHKPHLIRSEQIDYSSMPLFNDLSGIQSFLWYGMVSYKALKQWALNRKIWPFMRICDFMALRCMHAIKLDKKNRYFFGLYGKQILLIDRKKEKPPTWGGLLSACFIHFLELN